VQRLSIRGPAQGRSRLAAAGAARLGECSESSPRTALRDFFGLALDDRRLGAWQLWKFAAEKAAEATKCHVQELLYGFGREHGLEDQAYKRTHKSVPPVDAAKTA